jgi:hypothetical protein
VTKLRCVVGLEEGSRRVGCGHSGENIRACRGSGVLEQWWGKWGTVEFDHMVRQSGGRIGNCRVTHPEIGIQCPGNAKAGAGCSVAEGSAGASEGTTDHPAMTTVMTLAVCSHQ